MTVAERCCPRGQTAWERRRILGGVAKELVRVIGRWKGRARQLKTETYAMYFACKDPRAPWYAKFVALLVAGYAFSPIDPIPDFIPLIGFLDELVILPLGIALALRLMRPSVLLEARERAGSAVSWPVRRDAA